MQYRRSRNFKGRFISLRRREIGYTQNGFAKRCGLDQSMVSRWEAGIKAVPLSAIRQLARGLRISDTVLRKELAMAEIKEILFKYGFNDMEADNYSVKISRKDKSK